MTIILNTESFQKRNNSKLILKKGIGFDLKQENTSFFCIFVHRFSIY